MKTKFMAGMLVAIAATGVTSSAFADSFIEQKTVTSEGCPSSITRTTTETTATPVVAAPIVEERATTIIERPVMIETPVVERKIFRTGHDTVKMKEYYW
jgi:hypothetical protein